MIFSPVIIYECLTQILRCRTIIKNVKIYNPAWSVYIFGTEPISWKQISRTEELLH